MHLKIYIYIYIPSCGLALNSDPIKAVPIVIFQI